MQEDTAQRLRRTLDHRMRQTVHVQTCCVCSTWPALRCVSGVRLTRGCHVPALESKSRAPHLLFHAVHSRVRTTHGSASLPHLDSSTGHFYDILSRHACALTYSTPPKRRVIISGSSKTPPYLNSTWSQLLEVDVQLSTDLMASASQEHRIPRTVHSTS